MITTKDIAWLAGFLEGEGAFLIYDSTNKRGQRRQTIKITVTSTDRDVLQHAADLLCSNVLGPYRYGDNKKWWWSTTLCGGRAAAWMMTLYSLLGMRRKSQICKCLAHWRANGKSASR